MRRCLAFWHELYGERPSLLGATMASGPSGPMVVPISRRGDIPPLSILRWAEFKGLDPEITELVIAVIRRLDEDRAEAEANKERAR